MKDRRDRRGGKNQGPRVNNEIFASECRLIGDDGTQYGVVSIGEARRISEDLGLDLIEVSPNVSPPVVKLIDYGKFKYNQQKKKSDAKKKQAVTQLKEVQFRPNIEAHDLETKLSRIRRFLHLGDKVKLVMQFRGREMAYKDAGWKKFEGIIDRVVEMGGKIESEGKMMNNRIITILVPDKKRIKEIKREEAKKQVGLAKSTSGEKKSTEKSL